MTGMNTVSVVMATYNGEKYLREQMDSIIAQTYPIHELIVQDDGSTDSTVDILREYADRYGFVHVYRNATNLGYKENFRTATMRATGEFICLADQDDVWFDCKIERQVSAIGNHDVCYSQHLRGNDLEHATLVTYKNAPERQMFAAIVGHSLLMRREYAQDNRFWLRYMAHDIGLSLFAHFHGGVVRVDEPLNWHRSHDDSVSTSAHLLVFNDKNHHPTWQPYVYGFANYRRLQKKENWIRFHTKVQSESKDRNVLVYRLSSLLLNNSLIALMKLCFLCMKHRDTVYPGNNTAGIKGAIRGFFYPFIHSYHCTFYDS